MMTTDGAALVPSFLSVCVAAYAVYVATRQSRLAAEKLRVDFFDRRFTVWEATNAAVGKRLNYLSGLGADAYVLGKYDEMTSAGDFYEARRQAQYLFGAEVLAQFDEIERGLGKYLMARIEAANLVDGISPEVRIEIAAKPGHAYMEVIRQQEVLMELVGPYLDLSHIAVMRPRWIRLVRPWRRLKLGAASRPPTR